MTRAQLKASRIRWRRRLSWRKRRLAAAKTPEGRAKWQGKVDEAERLIARRTRQIEASTPLRLKAFVVAESLVGVMEQGGNNRGPKVEEIILSNSGVIGEPWCGDFVAFCYRAAGSRAVSRPWASVWWLGRLAAVQKVTTDEVRRGDLVRFEFSHVGLFDKWVDKSAGVFRTIEGNTGATGAVSDSKTGGDGVYRKTRYLSQVEDFRKVTR